MASAHVSSRYRLRPRLVLGMGRHGDPPDLVLLGGLLVPITGLEPAPGERCGGGHEEETEDRKPDADRRPGKPAAERKRQRSTSRRVAAGLVADRRRGSGPTPHLCRVRRA